MNSHSGSPFWGREDSRTCKEVLSVIVRISTPGWSGSVAGYGFIQENLTEIRRAAPTRALSDILSGRLDRKAWKRSFIPSLA
jgi:hypothetical protein